MQAAGTAGRAARREQHQRMVQDLTITVAPAAAHRRQGKGLPGRRVMEILLMASGGERSKLGVAPQNRACRWLSFVKTTNGDRQDPRFEWVLKTSGMRALPDPGQIQLQIQ